ncbi:MAG: hypothetical protein M1376_07390 [Planctomycetes bacterium]|nr:hypothetical protein [Planctomycetota bacterium]
MFSCIVGGIFVFLGVLSLLYPESLRRRLRSKALWKLRRYLFAAALSLGILLISAGWRHEGLLPKILVLVGIVALFKGLLFLNSRVSEKVTAWILERPVLHIRLFAVGQIVLGLLLLVGLRG